MAQLQETLKVSVNGKIFCRIPRLKCFFSLPVTRGSQRGDRFPGVAENPQAFSWARCWGDRRNENPSAFAPAADADGSPYERLRGAFSKKSSGIVGTTWVSGPFGPAAEKKA